MRELDIQTTVSHIIKKITKAPKGTLFFNEDFARFGSADAIKKALSRLEKDGELVRVARGIYMRPKISKLINKPLLPSVHDIAKAIAKRDRARIIPTGVMALYQLGISTQIPMKAVYLTDGSPRSVQAGKSRIVFKKTAPKNLAVQGEISNLVIQAMKEIGQENFTNENKIKILELLQKEHPHKIKHNLPLVPEWIRKVMKEVL